MMHYVCKYTPLELLAAYDIPATPLDDEADDFDLSDRVAHANLCGFGKSIIQAALSGHVDELVLVNCCDTMRRVHEIIADEGCCSFLHMIDLPHCIDSCACTAFAGELARLSEALAIHTGRTFDRQAFIDAFDERPPSADSYVSIMGVRAGAGLESLAQDIMPLPVRNLTCTGLRNVAPFDVEVSDADDDMMSLYAHALLAQPPCERMADAGARKRLLDDPGLKGIIYHTMKFCDFYGIEYAAIKHAGTLPLLKIETDFTTGSAGQMKTRLEAFAETIGTSAKKGTPMELAPGHYVAGIDSGSTSTDVVIMDAERTIVASAIIPTGGGAQTSAEKSLEAALRQGAIDRNAIDRIVTTGYGRAYLDTGDDNVTEITCHAKGAHFLNPATRTIIDIGGQDSKAIRIDEDGHVKNFVMNDKCAAGTGRFLELMARTLGLSLEEMSRIGLDWNNQVTISNMCTVFAESEVVSLVAQSVAVADIVHGLNVSVASKTASLAKRVGPEPGFAMTGGVAKNPGIVVAIEEKLGEKLFISDQAQLCGAIGAALFALGE